MTLESILTGIQSASNSDLNEIIEAVKLRRTRLSRDTVRSLCVGDRVSFKGRSGTITKLNRKTAVVDCGVGGSWRVAASLLSWRDQSHLSLFVRMWPNATTTTETNMTQWGKLSLTHSRNITSRTSETSSMTIESVFELALGSILFIYCAAICVAAAVVIWREL